jgi:serine/threonine protein kinase pknA
VHRDIKPGNLMITQNGQVKITDFGIAKAAASVPLTRTGMVVGTAQYVSPEQAQGKEVTPASDIYSLGVVGYEMLGGKRPFSGDSSVSIALAHINQEPEPLSTTISAPARELIRIALRKDPNTRYADGNEFTVAVSDVRLGKRPPQPKSIPPHQQAPEPSPSASTEMLADVAQPTTIHPAAGTAASASAPQRKATPAPVNDSKGGKSFLKGLGIVAAIALLAAAGYAIMNLMSSEGGDSEPSSTQETSVVTEYRDPTTTQVETLEEDEGTNETPQEVTVTETEPTDQEGNQAPRDNRRQQQTPNQQAPTRNQQRPNAPTQQRQPQQRQPQETHVENTPEQKNTVNSQPDELPGDLSDLLRQDGD